MLKFIIAGLLILSFMSSPVMDKTWEDEPIELIKKGGVKCYT